MYINYGDFPNIKLLRLYGFAININPFDYVEIFCPMSSNAPNYDSKLSIISSKGFFLF